MPLAALAIALVAVGGTVFAVGAAAIGVLALVEACRLLSIPSLVAASVCVGLVAITVLVQLEGRQSLAPTLAIGLALSFVATLALSPRAPVRTQTIAGAWLGLVWIGFGVAHAVLIRELDHGGGLLLDVLLAVFIGDTAAHLAGSLLGRRQLAPSISPSKTVEGLAAGLLAGTCAPVIAALAFQPWLAAGDAALIGLVAALAAVAGDLFESQVKRDAGVKDSGTMLGPHGGALDRIDAVLFASVASYYAAVGLL